MKTECSPTLVVAARGPGSPGEQSFRSSSARGGYACDLPDLSIDIASINGVAERGAAATATWKAPAYYTLSPRSAASSSKVTSVPATPIGPSPLISSRSAVGNATASLTSPPGGAVSQDGKIPAMTLPASSRPSWPLYSPGSLEASYAGLDSDELASSRGTKQCLAAEANEISSPPQRVALRELCEDASKAGDAALGIAQANDCGVHYANGAESNMEVPFKLRVKIVGAKGLRNADPIGFGKSDPYCICELSAKPSSKTRTHTVDNCLDPEWNHVCDFSGVDLSDTLEFSVFDKDQWPKRDDLLGTAKMPSRVFYPDGFRGDVVLVDPEASSADAGKAPPALSLEIEVLGSQESGTPRVNDHKHTPQAATPALPGEVDVLQTSGIPAIHFAELVASPMPSEPSKPDSCDADIPSLAAVSDAPVGSSFAALAPSGTTLNSSRSAQSRNAEVELLEQRLRATEEENRMLRERRATEVEHFDQRLRAAEEENQMLRGRIRDLLQERERSLDLQAKCAALEDERNCLRAEVLRLEGLRRVEFAGQVKATSSPEPLPTVQSSGHARTGPGSAKKGSADAAGSAATPPRTGGSLADFGSPPCSRPLAGPLATSSPPPPSKYSMLRICQNLPRNLGASTPRYYRNLDFGDADESRR